MSKVKVFWTPAEEDLIFKHIKILEDAGRLQVPMTRNFDHAQIAVLDKNRHRPWTNSSGASSDAWKRYELWKKGGVEALIRPKKVRTSKTHSTVTVTRPVTVDMNGVDTYHTKQNPTPPIPSTISIDGLLSELVARAACAAMLPVSTDLKASMAEMMVALKASMAEMMAAHKVEIASMHADHKAVIEGMFEDNYARLTNFWSAPADTTSASQNKPQIEPQKPSAIEISKGDKALEQIAANMHTPKKPRVLVFGAKPWVSQLRERLPNVDMFCSDDKTTRVQAGQYDLVVSTRFIDHAINNQLKRDYNTNYIHVPKGGITRVEATIRERLKGLVVNP